MENSHDVDGLLHSPFGLEEFRPGQREVIDALLEHKAALAVFPTGGGKSLCYQLPALFLDGATLVVSPLIALMKDQVDFLKSRGIPAERMDSTLTAAEALAIYDDVRANRLKILFVAPERFNNERFRSVIAKARISLFAVDEAHCISEWGHNFRPDYLKLAELAREMEAERILALTATATPAVVQDICSGFGIPGEAAIVTGFYRPNLRIQVTPLEPRGKDECLLQRLKERPAGSTIVYVTLQKTAERVAEFLQESEIPAKPYHAGMETPDRDATQEWWMAADGGVVVATIAFGMGIDKAAVRYIYHYNLPKSLESYSQEIGRAGRDGRESIVELFACADDVSILENFAYGDTPTRGSVLSLLRAVLGGGKEVDVSIYALSAASDIRMLVVRTALTYLELDGVVRQGTPFYAGYEMRPLVPVARIKSEFPGPPGEFVADIFSHAKHGRIWYGVKPDETANALGQERRRVIRAMEVMEERGLIELRAADVRLRFTRLQETPDIEALADGLLRRFEARESREIERVRQVLELAGMDGCISNALAAHFGERRDAPCGHCSWCDRREALSLPKAAPKPPLPGGLDVSVLAELRRTNPEALADPRQTARFLCGLSSPALTRAKLTRHTLFGALEDRSFASVLAWLQEGGG